MTALGGSETFTCEYHGDDAVSTVAWSYNGDTSLPAGYNVAAVGYLSIYTKMIEYDIFGEGSQISANQKRENSGPSLLISLSLRPFPKNTVLYIIR